MSKCYGWQSILLWPFNRLLLRHCKQAYRSAVNWLFVRIFWTSVHCRPTSNCRCCLLMSNSTLDARDFAVTDQPRWPSTILHVQERLIVSAHSETSKFNKSVSSHRLQTCLWPLTVALLYHSIHYTREFCHFSLYKSHSSNIVMSVTSSTDSLAMHGSSIFS